MQSTSVWAFHAKGTCLWYHWFAQIEKDGGWVPLIVSREMLIRNLECKSSANCMQLYVFLFFLAYPPLRSGHTLCIALRLSLRVSPFLNTEIIHKNSCLILRLKKKAAIYERYAYTLLCVLIIIRYYSLTEFYRLVRPQRPLKYTPSFPAKVALM